MAYDPRTEKLVLFGGRADAASFNDTWTYDGKTWTKQSPGNSPPARSEAAMAYDETIGSIVLYGGRDWTTTSVTDTWTYDGQTWMQQHPATTPHLMFPAMAYHSAIGKLVLVGTSMTTGGPPETWTYDGTTWTLQESKPDIWGPARPIDYNAALKKILLYSPVATWTYDGTVWTKEPAAPIPFNKLTALPAMAYDPATLQTVLFGGLGYDYENRAGQAGPPINDTWTYDGTTWTQQSPPTAPSPRYLAGMAYDPALNSLVLFGGAVSYGGQASPETWTYEPY
jgi:hypothetical protein